MRIRSAFTLVELLVVVVVITILAAILMPAFVTAKRKATATNCAANLHQMGVALQAYTADYDERLPCTAIDFRSGTAGVPAAWLQAMGPYLKSDGLTRCFDDTSRNWKHLAPAAREPRQSSYAPNGYLSGRYGFAEIARIPRPADTIWLVEQADNRSLEYISPMRWPQPGVTGLAIPPSTEVAVGRHQQGAYYLFVDGHAKWHRFEQTFAPPGVDRYRPH